MTAAVTQRWNRAEGGGQRRIAEGTGREGRREGGAGGRGGQQRVAEGTGREGRREGGAGGRGGQQRVADDRGRERRGGGTGQGATVIRARDTLCTVTV